jgi:hypothetical protein
VNIEKIKMAKSAEAIPLFNEDSLDREDGDDDAIAIDNIVRVMNDQGRAGVRAVRIFAQSLQRMAEAFGRDEDEFEETARIAHVALGDLHIDGDD